MKRTSFSDKQCSIALTLDIIGEWWTPLILRDILFDNRRFNSIQKNLGISKKVLVDRLDTLLEYEIIIRKAYKSEPLVYEYVLTKKGKELAPILLTMLTWGDKWVRKNKPSLFIRHKSCGHTIRPTVMCPKCLKPITHANFEGVPNISPPNLSKRQAYQTISSIAAAKKKLTSAK